MVGDSNPARVCHTSYRPQLTDEHMTPCSPVLCWPYSCQAVRAIGRCAVSLDSAAQRCIAVLLELIQTKVNYVVQEAVIVIKVS